MPRNERYVLSEVRFLASKQRKPQPYNSAINIRCLWYRGVLSSFTISCLLKTTGNFLFLLIDGSLTSLSSCPSILNTKRREYTVCLKYESETDLCFCCK